MRVIIPVGGEAKRLQPLTAEISKAVVRIFNRPIVEFAMASLALQGVKNFIFGVKGYVNYKSLFDYFKEGIGFSARYGISPRAHIKYQPHVEDVGSADSVRINMEYYDVDGPIMVVQGDNLFELDVRDVLAFHHRKEALMTVALTYVEDVERYGVAEVDREYRVRKFVEKPSRAESPSNLANTGIYLLSPHVKAVFNNPRVQEMIQNSQRLDFGMDFIPFLTENGYPIYGYVLKGEWYDVGTPKGYLETMLRILRSSENPFFYFGEQVPGFDRTWIQGQSTESIKRKEEIVQKAREGKIKLEGAVLIGRHCQIGDGAVIRDSCIDNFCVIGKSATIERSAVMDRSIVGDGANIEDSVIGRHVRVKSSHQRSTWVAGVSTVGDNATLGEGCFIVATKIFPHKVVSDGQKLLDESLE